MDQHDTGHREPRDVRSARRPMPPGEDRPGARAPSRTSAAGNPISAATWTKRLCACASAPCGGTSDAATTCSRAEPASRPMPTPSTGCSAAVASPERQNHRRWLVDSSALLGADALLGRRDLKRRQHVRRDDQHRDRDLRQGDGDESDGESTAGVVAGECQPRRAAEREGEGHVDPDRSRSAGDDEKLQHDERAAANVQGSTSVAASQTTAIAPSHSRSANWLAWSTLPLNRSPAAREHAEHRCVEAEQLQAGEHARTERRRRHASGQSVERPLAIVLAQVGARSQADPERRQARSPRAAPCAMRNRRRARARPAPTPARSVASASGCTRAFRSRLSGHAAATPAKPTRTSVSRLLEERGGRVPSSGSHQGRTSARPSRQPAQASLPCASADAAGAPGSASEEAIEGQHVDHARVGRRKHDAAAALARCQRQKAELVDGKLRLRSRAQQRIVRRRIASLELRAPAWPDSRRTYSAIRTSASSLGDLRRRDHPTRGRSPAALLRACAATQRRGCAVPSTTARASLRARPSGSRDRPRPR